MSEQRKRKRVKFLAGQYLSPVRRTHLRHRLDWDELEYALDRLRAADEVLQFLNDNRRDPYATLREPERTLSDAQVGLAALRAVMEKTGFLELLDDHLDTLMRSLSADGLPEQEADLLRALGFPRIADSVEGRADLLGHEWRNGNARGLTVLGELRRAPVTGALDQVIAEVERHAKERHGHRGLADNQEDSPKRKRRWWKGLGQVVQGGAIAGADVGLAVGILHVPVPDGDTTYGVIMSVTAGAGTIMNGVGDLWGE